MSIQFKIMRGSKASLPATTEPYTLLYTTDEKALYISGSDGIPHKVSKSEELIADLINDNATSSTSTWSSEKISYELKREAIKQALVF